MTPKETAEALEDLRRRARVMVGTVSEIEDTIGKLDEAAKAAELEDVSLAAGFAYSWTTVLEQEVRAIQAINERLRDHARVSTAKDAETSNVVAFRRICR